MMGEKRIVYDRTAGMKIELEEMDASLRSASWSPW